MSAWAASSSARDSTLPSSLCFEPVSDEEYCSAERGYGEANLPKGNQNKFELFRVAQIVAGAKSEIAEHGTHDDHHSANTTENAT